MLKPGSDPDEGDEALRFYAKHTAQIEVKDCSPRRWTVRQVCILRVVYLLF